MLLAVPAHAQLYDFNAGSGAYGWTLAGAYVDCNNPGSGCTPVTDNFTGMYWSDNTNYPTATIGADPVGDARGAIRFDTSAAGDGIVATGSYWYVHIVSPDLSSQPAWQHIYGLSVRLMSNMNPGSNWVNLILRVYDEDQLRDRYYFNVFSMAAITKSTWRTLTFDLTSASDLPARYTVKNLYINIAGDLAQNYTSGSIWIDDVTG